MLDTLTLVRGMPELERRALSFGRPFLMGKVCRLRSICRSGRLDIARLVSRNRSAALNMPGLVAMRRCAVLNMAKLVSRNCSETLDIAILPLDMAILSLNMAIFPLATLRFWLRFEQKTGITGRPGASAGRGVASRE